MVFAIWTFLQRLENTFFGPHDSSRIPMDDFHNNSALGNLDLWAMIDVTLYGFGRGK